MQTYTHLLMGLATAPHVSNEPWIQLAWIAGNILPDGTVATQFVLDKIRGKPPLVVEPPAWIEIKNLCHPLVLAAVIILFGIEHWAAILFGAGMATHILIDIFTHNREDSNCIYAYPFELKSYCLWEYRIGDGILRPKLPELVICLIFIGIIILNTLLAILW